VRQSSRVVMRLQCSRVAMSKVRQSSRVVRSDDSVSMIHSVLGKSA